MRKIGNTHIIGQIGEMIFAELYDAKLSDNEFDEKKDMMVNGLSVEIKTQNRHPRGFFTAHLNKATNLEKCISVDKLIFIEYDHSDKIKIYECVDREYEILPKAKDGSIKVGWPIYKMNLLETIIQPDISEKLRSLSKSKTFK